MTFVRTDILNPYSREIVSTQSYATLIKFLIDKYPSGFEGPVDISVNAKVIAVEDYDIALNENDVIVLLDRTALPIGLIGGPIITALANLAISVAISFVANKLFAPDAVDESKNASSVYNVASGQNIARYGSPVPIVYGKIRMYPSLIVHPYKRYEDNIQYLYHLMCITQGRATTDDVLIAEDQITSTDDLQWKLLYKEDFYDIPGNAYGVHVTSTLSNPSNMEIEVNEDLSPAESEKYTIRKDAEFVEFDYVYPNGLIYYESDGETTAIRTEFVARIYTSNGAGGYNLQKTVTIYKNVSNVTPLRFTHRENISEYDQPVYISFEKTLNAASSWYVTNTVIERVKEIYPNEDFTNLYCDKTMLACRIKATDAVSALGQVKVNAYFTRTDVGNMMDDVLRDIYINTKYGAGLSNDDLYFPVTSDRVDCVYEENMTIFDAMRKPAIAQGYSVFLAGQDVILKKDGVNDVLSGMYNEQNISKGSVKSQYLFKEETPSYDGFEVHYILGEGWLPMVYTYPENSVRPQRIDLFGVVDWGGVKPPSYTHYYEDYFSEISSDWVEFGTPEPKIVEDQDAENGSAFSSNGDNTYNSGATLNNFPIPTDTSCTVDVRMKQPKVTSSDSGWEHTYIRFEIRTLPSESDPNFGSRGNVHALVQVDGGAVGGSATEQSIKFAVENPIYTPVTTDGENDEQYHEYSFIYNVVGDGTAEYTLKKDGVERAYGAGLLPLNSHYYINLEGKCRDDGVENYVDYIKAAY